MSLSKTNLDVTGEEIPSPIQKEPRHGDISAEELKGIETGTAQQ